MYMCVVFRLMEWVRSLKEKAYVEMGREISTKQSAGTLHTLMIREKKEDKNVFFTETNDCTSGICYTVLS